MIYSTRNRISYLKIFHFLIYRRSRILEDSYFFITYSAMIESCIKKENRAKLHHCKREKIVLWEDMSLLAMKSLYEEKDNDGYMWSEA